MEAYVGKHALSPHTTAAKFTTRLQNNYHPGSSETQAVWKSDNQGFKEATFTQRVGGADTRRGADKQQNGWSYIYLWWIKTGGDTSGVRHPSRRPDHPVQGSRTRKISPPNFWL